MTNKYYPCVIIGLGGTGIKVLRMLKAIAEHKDNNLKRRLDNGSIQLLGIDTDPKSNNSLLQLDANLVNLEGIKQGQNEEIPRTLPTIDDWVLIDPHAINDALPKVHQTLDAMGTEGQNGNQDNLFDDVLAAHKSIARWFPHSDPKTGSQITQGHSKMAGAAQWRPLGRMALFLEAQKIYGYLQKAMKKVKDESREIGYVRSYIVSSLAGGTGSGMFWDVAFMLHMIEKELKNYGFFLLADPFESVDEAGRLLPNSYAAVKEMVTLKNARLKTPLQVHYPISEAGLVYEMKPRGGVIFDMIYLNQSYTPGFGVADHNKSTIDVTCYRMAQNIMAQLRADLHSELDVGANNMSSDVTAMPFSREAGFAFSTSATTQFTLSSSDLLKELFYKNWVSRIQFNIQENTAVFEKPGSYKDPLMVDRHLPSAVHKWCQTTIASFTQNPPQELTSETRRFKEGKDLLTDMECEKTPKQLFEAYVESRYRKKWQSVGPEDDCPPIELTSENISEEFANDIEKKISDYIQLFQNRAEHFKTHHIILTDTESEGYKRLKEWLGKKEDKDGGGKTDLQAGKMFLRRPVAYVKAYNYLNDRDESFLYDYLFTSLKKREDMQNRPNHVTQLIEKLFDELIEQMAQQQTKSEQIIQDAFNDKWEQQKKKLTEAIDTILETNADRITTNEECRQIEQLVSPQSQLETFITAEPGQVDALFRAALPGGSAGIIQTEDWYEDHAKALGEEIEETIQNYLERRSGGALKQSHLRHDLPCRKTESLEDALIKLVKDNARFDTEDQEDTEEYTARKIDAITDYLIRLLPIEGEYLLDPSFSKLYTELVREVIGNIIEYWVDHSNILLQKSGGEEGLRQRLVNCRSDVFRNGVIENRLKKRHLVIIPPKQTREKRAHLYKQDKIKQMFSNTSQEVMQITPTVSNQGSDLPIIYYDDLFRSAEEINKISDYYKAYTGYPQSARRLFHVCRDWAGFDEVVGEGASYDPIYCGNPECDLDIRRLPRSIQICPKCQNPIWNRCGNEACSADNIYDTIKKQVGENNTRYPYKCPECGEELKNYWWECPEHHSKIPMDKEICPYCLAEYQAEKRSQDKIGKRANLSVQHCPGCLKKGRSETESIKIPQPLIEYYNNGVNGHDTLHFKKLIKEYKFDPHLCNDRGNAHYIFPTCPEGIENPDTRHHLFKDENGNFFCMHHPRIRFYSCAQCGYPIRHNEDREGSPEEIQCPRCFSTLKKCSFCSNKYKQFYAPENVQNQIDRCPNCRNLMEISSNQNQDVVSLGIETPGFCRNIFVCNAASELWHTSSDFDLKTCRVCPESRQGDRETTLNEVSYLLPRENLKEYIDDCPLCMALLGNVDDNGSFKESTGEDIYRHFTRRHEQGGWETVNICRICGSNPNHIFLWMLHTGFFRDAQIDADTARSQGKAVDLPKTSFPKALEILTILYSIKDDRKAYNEMKKLLSLNYMLNNFQAMRQDIMSMFDRSFITVIGLSRRFEGLERYNADILAREKQGVL